jgi:hypothetical protein
MMEELLGAPEVGNRQNQIQSPRLYISQPHFHTPHPYHVPGAFSASLGSGACNHHQMASPQAAMHPKTKPLIPERYLDVPSQRLYYLSLAALCQVSVAVDYNCMCYYC